MTIRKPVVAGMFYPAEKEVLKAKIKNFLQKVKAPREKNHLRILIVPHAGYQYSGLVAAAGFSQLQGKDYRLVILIGVSHSTYFSGAAVDENEIWETPLGGVKINKDLANKIVAAVQGTSFASEPHTQEHSLEVELPFLQVVLGKFTLLPLLLGKTEPSFLEEAASFLAKKIDKKTIIVISTDFSHYPPYQLAKAVDRLTIDAVLSGEPEKFEEVVKRQMSKDYPYLATCCCGEKAVKLGMKLAQNLGKGKWQLLRYANSGDPSAGGAGEKDRVVGYAAISWNQK